MTTANTNKPEVSAGAIDVIKLAMHSGLRTGGNGYWAVCHTKELKAFANAVLEAAAKECDYVTKNARPSMTMSAYQTGAINCAAAIREMKK